MTRAGFAVAVIALVSTVGLATEECCTSAQAQTQPASPEPTIWDHNGSVMYLVANGSSREIYYQKPRDDHNDRCSPFVLVQVFCSYRFFCHGCLGCGSAGYLGVSDTRR